MSSTVGGADNKPSIDVSDIYPIVDDFGLEDWLAWDDDLRSGIILGYFIGTYNWLDLFTTKDIDIIVEIMDETKTHGTWSLMRVVTDYLEENPQVSLRAAFILPFTDAVRWVWKEDTK